MKTWGLIFCLLLLSTTGFALEDSTETAQELTLEEQAEFFEKVAYMTDRQRDFEYQLCVADCRKDFATPSLISMQNSCINLCGATRQLPLDILTF